MAAVQSKPACKPGATELTSVTFMRCQGAESSAVYLNWPTWVEVSMLRHAGNKQGARQWEARSVELCNQSAGGSNSAL